MELTEQQVLGALSGAPCSVVELGLKVATGHGHDRDPSSNQPVGQWLASVGLSLSGLQKLVDVLVRDGRTVEVRGRQLWEMGLPTAGTKAQGRYYLRAAPGATAHPRT